MASSLDRAVSMSVLEMRLSSRGRDGASASSSCGGVEGYSVACGSTKTKARRGGRVESTASGSGRHSRRPGSSAGRKPVRASDTAIRRGALSKMPPSTYRARSASDARHTPGVAVSPATHVRSGCGSNATGNAIEAKTRSRISWKAISPPSSVTSNGVGTAPPGDT